MKAIPTRYAGATFRSRLEARWAAFFDLADLRWIYEPFDLEGWTPDFILRLDAVDLLVEVKPYTMLTVHDIDEEQELYGKALAHQPLPLLLLGLDPRQEGFSIGRVVADAVLKPSLRAALRVEGRQYLWSEAGSRVRWKGV